MECCIDELGLETGYLLDILQVPVLHSVGSLVESSLATTGSIEEYPVKSLRYVFPILSWIERDTDMRSLHAFEVLQELWDALTSWFVRYNPRIREVFCELSCLASRAGRHIQYQEGIILYTTICKYIDGCCSS